MDTQKKLASVDYCRPLPDGDILFRGLPTGCCLKVDGTLYVRQSEWIAFLERIHRAATARA